MRWPSALVGLAWYAALLPVTAQESTSATQTLTTPLVESIRQQATQAIPSSGGNTSVTTLSASGRELMDSYELCQIGRMGQHELSFLTVFILIGCFIFFLQIDRRLIKHGWEIRKALSEASDLSFVSSGTNAQPLLDRKGQAINVRVLEPSISRLIALSGLIMLILFYFGFGLISMYHFGRTCEMPGDIQGVTTFLYAGLTFFAPYLVSKFSSIFGTPGRHLPLSSTRRNLPSMPAEPPAADAAEHDFTGQQTLLSDATSSVATPEITTDQTSPAAPPSGASSAAVVDGNSPTAHATVLPVTSAHREGVDLIKEFEGFRDKAYPDPATGGDPWTIGYGFTRIDNKPVVSKQTITRAASDQLLEKMLGAMADRYSNKIPFWNEMHDKQQSCLLSFGWNLGENFYGDESSFHTITQCLRNKDWPKVPDALLLYCMPGSSVHEGLLRRRKAEANLWNQGMNEAHSPTSLSSASVPSSEPTKPKAQLSSTKGSHSNPLQVEYFDQMLMDDGQG